MSLDENRNKLSCTRLLNFFFSMKLNIRLHHWNTDSFARHKATDEFLSKFESLSDRFIEIYQAQYGKIFCTNSEFSVQVMDLKNNELEQLLDKAITFFKDDLIKDNILDEKDTELLNIRDEIVGDIQQLKYLLTFN
jgi:hypothetical protein